MKKSKIRITSIGVAFFLMFSHPLVVKAPDKYGSDNVYLMDTTNTEYHPTISKSEIREYETADDDIEVIIPADELTGLEIYKDESEPIKGEECPEGFKTTVGELHKVTKIDFSKNNYTHCYNPHDYSWLNYCNRDLKELDIVVTNSEDFKNVRAFNSIERLSIKSNSRDASIRNMHFLRDTSINHLILDGPIDYEYIYELKNIDHLEISSFSLSCNLNLKKLGYIKEITFSDDLYNIAMFSNMKEIEDARKNGKTINIGKNNELEGEFRKLDQKLNDIIKSFNLSPFATNEDKIEAVLVYCLENFTYDKDVALASDDDEKNYKYFYGENENERLYAALEKKSQICGNYAGMMYALLRRMGVDSYILKGHKHAFNLVKYNDGYYYIVDATWLDDDYIIKDGQCIDLEHNKSLETIKSGNKKDINNLKWNKKNPWPHLNINPDDDPKIDRSHNISTFPNHVIEIKKEDALFYKITINVNEYIVPITIALALILVLDLGYLAVELDKYNEKKARNAARRRVTVSDLKINYNCAPTSVITNNYYDNNQARLNHEYYQQSGGKKHR